MKLHFHDLEGGGIAEDKRMINAKSPWTLAHLDMKILQGFYNNPAVPPSMKTKLKGAMMMKPSLKKKKLSGGLAGVSKASGFIQRMMAENKLKHSGEYKKPTDPAHKDSTMSQWMAFDYKKLANKDQGGEGEAEYGASPFIQKYFKGDTVPFTRGNTAKETQKQKEARLTMMAKRLAKLARKLAREQPQNQEAQEEVQEAREAVEERREEPAPVETPAELLEHFGNVSMGEPPVGIEVKPKEKSAEEATPANPVKRVLKLKKPRQFVDADTGKVLHDESKVPKNEIVSTAVEEEVAPEEDEEVKLTILSDDVLNNRIWGVYVCFWNKFVKKFKKAEFSRYDWTQPFYSLTYTHGGFWRDFYYAAPIEIYKGEKKQMYKEFLMKWMGYKEDQLVERQLRAYPEVKFWGADVSEEEHKRREEGINDKKNLMGWSYILWMCGKLVKEHSYKMVIEESDYRIYNHEQGWLDKRGERLLLKAPESKEGKDEWDITTMLTQNYDGKGAIGKDEYEKPNYEGGRGEMDKFWKDVVYKIADETDIDIDDNIFAELEPDDGLDRDAMKVMMEYIEKETKKRKAEEDEKKPKKPTARSGQSGSKREENIKKILEADPKASLTKIAGELLKLGDSGKGGKALSAGTLSPIVKKVKEAMKEEDEDEEEEEDEDEDEAKSIDSRPTHWSGDGHLRMRGV